MATAASAGEETSGKKNRRRRRGHWLLFPEFQKVYAYTGPEEVAICKGEAICSAEKAIPGFPTSAADLFRKG
ncbi:MAG: hypothetical protein J5I98_03915 [Phaeodactylibacter sp.]|nr:hypothetical protein [Phaeodactylibacter sp.]